MMGVTNTRASTLAHARSLTVACNYTEGRLEWMVYLGCYGGRGVTGLLRVYIIVSCI